MYIHNDLINYYKWIVTSAVIGLSLGYVAMIFADVFGFINNYWILIPFILVVLIPLMVNAINELNRNNFNYDVHIDITSYFAKKRGFNYLAKDIMNAFGYLSDDPHPDTTLSKWHTSESNIKGIFTRRDRDDGFKRNRKSFNNMFVKEGTTVKELKINLRNDLILHIQSSRAELGGKVVYPVRFYVNDNETEVEDMKEVLGLSSYNQAIDILSILQIDTKINYEQEKDNSWKYKRKGK